MAPPPGIDGRMVHRLEPLWRRNEVWTPAWCLLAVAAAAVGVAGYFHGHLYAEGYASVRVVGPLFLLNAIGSGVVIAAFLLGRVLLFALGALGISLGSVVSILISHSTSFFRFAEHRYDSRALTIVIAEIAALVLIVIAGGLVARRTTTATRR